MNDWITPAWPAPAGVHACSTTRLGGVSAAPYLSLNLADHVGDDPEAVSTNRQRLAQVLGLTTQPKWLNQVHGTRCVDAASVESGPGMAADAAFTDRTGIVCAVMTADCLPLLVCDRAGTHVAAIHAGWRGLAAGVIESTIAMLKVPVAELNVWLGPAIGSRAFEVGDEVRDIFLQHDAKSSTAFLASARISKAISGAVDRRGRWYADIYLLARQRLAALGIAQVYGGDYCTYSDARFYSYRRAGVTGRMATLIWLE